MVSDHPTIVIVDDDPHTCAMLRCVLGDEGFRVVAFTDTTGIMERARRGDAALFVLDIGIGAADGLALLERLNTLPARPPVVFLSGRDDPATRRRAFALGALDYMSKPIDIVELAARVRVALRRAGHAGRAPRSARLEGLGLTLDRGRGMVTRRDGTTVRLTPREAAVLAHLLARAGQVVGHEELLVAVWGSDFVGGDDVVAVYVGRLRRKLGADEAAIRTLRGLGYALDRRTAGRAGGAGDEGGGRDLWPVEAAW